MTAAFENAFAQVLNFEGGLSNHPLDRGGLTKYGITHATWDAYVAEVRPFDRRKVNEITLDDAKAVYVHGFWSPLGLDAINDMRVSAEIFDVAVNCGTGEAAECAQRAFNFIRTESLPAIAVDSRMGPVTRQSINKMSAIDADAMLAGLNIFQGEYYIRLVERKPEQRVFARGWAKRCLVYAKNAK